MQENYRKSKEKEQAERREAAKKDEEVRQKRQKEREAEREREKEKDRKRREREREEREVKEKERAKEREKRREIERERDRCASACLLESGSKGCLKMTAELGLVVLGLLGCGEGKFPSRGGHLMINVDAAATVARLPVGTFDSDAGTTHKNLAREPGIQQTSPLSSTAGGSPLSSLITALEAGGRK